MKGAKRSSLTEGELDRVGELCFAFQYTWCWVIGFWTMSVCPLFMRMYV